MLWYQDRKTEKWNSALTKSEKLEAKEDLFIASVLHTKAVITAVSWITNCVTELSSKSFLCLLKLLPCNCLLQRLVYQR